MGFGHRRCRMVAWSCALTGNSNPVFLLWESGLESHVFLPLFFLLLMYFRIFLEKIIEQLLAQSHEPTTKDSIHISEYYLWGTNYIYAIAALRKQSLNKVGINFVILKEIMTRINKYISYLHAYPSREPKAPLKIPSLNQITLIYTFAWAQRATFCLRRNFSFAIFVVLLVVEVHHLELFFGPAPGGDRGASEGERGRGRGAADVSIKKTANISRLPQYPCK